jgi:hypothetical protein
VSFLTEQIGPLPGGAWLGVIGGGLAIGFLGRRKSVAAAQPAVPAQTAQDQSSQGAVQYVTSGTGVTSMGTPTYATNEEWASSAVAYLIGRGTLASRATNAISHVLYPDASHPTTAEDSALYNMAAAGVGLPPSLPSQAFIPDPPAVNITPVNTALAAHSDVYANGVRAGWGETYSAGPYASVDATVDPQGRQTGLGILDRLGNLYAYVIDPATNKITGGSYAPSGGTARYDTAEEIDAANVGR